MKRHNIIQRSTKPTMLLLLLLFVAATLVPASSSTLSEKVVQATLDHVQNALQRNNQESPIPLEGLSRDIQELENGIKRLQDLQSELHFQKVRLQSLANARKLQQLVDRLEETYQKEQAIRQYIKENREANVVEGEDGDNDVESLENVATLKMLQERLDTNAIVQESERQLKEWILQLVQNGLDQYKDSTLEPASQIAATSAAGASGAVSTSATAACPVTSDIVQRIQQALTDYANDGIGKVDHLQQHGGAKVVHWLTSDTYVPPKQQTLGSVWWGKYIPQDWERLLPEHWEEWDVSLPSYLTHSLVCARKLRPTTVDSVGW
jgi:TolA-binding protein